MRPSGSMGPPPFNARSTGFHCIFPSPCQCGWQAFCLGPNLLNYSPSSLLLLLSSSSSPCSIPTPLPYPPPISSPFFLLTPWPSRFLALFRPVLKIPCAKDGSWLRSDQIYAHAAFQPSMLLRHFVIYRAPQQGTEVQAFQVDSS